MTILDPAKDLIELFSEFFGTDSVPEKKGNLKNRFMDGVVAAGVQRKVRRDWKVPRS